MLKNLLKLIGDTFQPVYFVYDGAFGNNAAVQMTRQVGLHLISKLRNDSALYFEWAGVYSGKGRRPSSTIYDICPSGLLLLFHRFFKF